MSNELETERFRKLLLELIEERDGDKVEPSGPFTPLSPALERRLLQLSLPGGPPPLPLHRRLLAWLRAKLLRRLWIPLVLAPTTAALLFLQLAGGPPLRYAHAPVAQRKLYAAKAEMTRSPGGQVLLGSGAAALAERTELRLKRSDMLTVRLPPAGADKGPLAVRTFIRRDSVLRPWNVTPELRPDGSVLLLLPVRMLPDLGADQEILFVYGRPDGLPDLAAQPTAIPDAGARWRASSLRLRIED